MKNHGPVSEQTAIVMFYLGSAIESTQGDVVLPNGPKMMIGFCETVSEGWNRMNDKERGTYDDSVEKYMKQIFKEQHMYDLDERKPLEIDFDVKKYKPD